jgi:flagellar protein FlaG
MNGHSKVAPISAVPAASSSQTQNGFKDSRAGRDAERNAQYRLVIEEGPSQGSFVYKILDRVTGEVVRQLPREQVVELMRNDGYSIGSVIDTNA